VLFILANFELGKITGILKQEIFYILESDNTVFRKISCDKTANSGRNFCIGHGEHNFSQNINEDVCLVFYFLFILCCVDFKPVVFFLANILSR
jgi:hypothetical protein